MVRPAGLAVSARQGGKVRDVVSHEGATGTCGEGKLIRICGGTLTGILCRQGVESALREDPRKEGIYILVKVLCVA